MDQKEGKERSLKKAIRWISSALGTFLYVFLMMHTIVIHTSGLYNGGWLVPYFSYPAYMVCLTIAASYWIGENRVRLRSYYVSTLISPVILLCGGAYFMPGYVVFSGFRSILAALFTVAIVLYGIWHYRKKIRNSQQRAAERKPLQVTRSDKWRRTARIICLLSICCVLFENFQESITVTYGFLTHMNFGMSLSVVSQYPLCILSAILLARFVKAEFLPIKAPSDGDVS